MRIPRGPLSTDTRSQILSLRRMDFFYAIVRRTNHGIVEPGHVESVFNHMSDAIVEQERLAKMYPKCPQGGPGFVLLDLLEIEQSGVAA